MDTPGPPPTVAPGVFTRSPLAIPALPAVVSGERLHLALALGFRSRDRQIPPVDARPVAFPLDLQAGRLGGVGSTLRPRTGPKVAPLRPLSP